MRGLRRADGLQLEDLLREAEAGVRAGLGRISQCDADISDAFQQASIQVWRHFSEFDARKTSFEGWLFFIARRRLLGMKRARLRRRHVPLKHVPYEHHGPTDLLDVLPADLRPIADLTAQGCEQHEIGTLLSLSKWAVQRRCEKIRKIVSCELQN
jgi:DNA-directed RNA polymerase specialized sigma24 family protein